MTERNLKKKYEIMKARVGSLVEEHADALALAQVFKEESEQAKYQSKQLEEKISILEGNLKKYDIQKKDPTVTIIDGDAMVSPEDKS